MSDDLELKIRLTADGKGLVGEVRKGDKVLTEFGEAIDNTAKKTDKNTKAVKNNNEAVKKGTKGAKAAAKEQGNLAKKTRGGSEALKRLSRSGGLASKSLKLVGIAARSVALGIAGFAGVGALSIAALVPAILSVSKEYQSLSAQLVVVTGNQAAASAAFSQWREFASQTPSQVSEIVNAFIKLRNFGLRATERDLMSYGNTAAATGRTLTQFIEAIADASTLEFERLKEFGILSRQESDSIRFTFRGVTTEIQKDSESIQNYLRKIGEVEFAGAQAEQMKTLGGAASNLADGLKEFLFAAGEWSGVSEGAALIANKTAISARKLAVALNPDDLEKYSRISARIVDLQQRLDNTKGNGFWKDRERSSLQTLLDEKKAEFSEIQKVVVAARKAIKASDDALVAQNKVAAENRAKDRIDQEKDRLSKELTLVREYSLSREELEKSDYKKRLDLLNDAENAGVDAVMPYNELRKRLVAQHLDNIKSIVLTKQLEIDQAANESREKENQRRSDYHFLKIAQIQGFLQEEIDLDRAQKQRFLVEEQKHQDRLRSIRLKNVGDYGGIVQKFVDLDRQSGAARLSTALDIGTQISGAAAQHSKKAFEMHKKLSMAQAGISAALSIIQVLGDASIPSTYAKVAMSAAIGGLAFAQIRQIESQKYQGGRMFGGDVSANAFVEVGEHNRPELFKQDGNMFLFPGNRGGEVIPFDRNRRGAGNPSPSPAAPSRPVEVHIHNAPEGVKVEQDQDRIDVYWPEIQSRLANDLSSGADWVDTGAATFGWSRSSGARVRR